MKDDPNPSPDDQRSFYEAATAFQEMPKQTQTILACLAPFTKNVNRGLLETYVAALQQQPTLANLALATWKEAVEAAQARNLLRPHPSDPNYLAIPPGATSVFRAVARSDGRAYGAITFTFHEVYQQFNLTIYKGFQSQSPSELDVLRAVMSLEYDNMVSALRLALNNRRLVAGFLATINHYLQMSRFYDRALTLGNWVLAELDRRPAKPLNGEARLERAFVMGGTANLWT